MRQNKNEELMAAGVTLVDPATTYIDPRAEIGGDTVIHPGVIIEGATRIGKACEIQAHVRIADAEIGDHVNINSFCVIVESRVADGAVRRPLRAPPARRPTWGAGAKIGNFVELKKTTLGARLESEPPRRTSATPPLAPTSTSAPAPSPATTTARRSIRPSSKTARSSAATRSSWRR